MKQQLPASRHDRHDATLIVRLYDGDVGEGERTRATDLIATCGECAALYADLAAISTATRLLPTPARPRDFILTEADATRLGRPAGVPAAAGARAGAGAGTRGGLVRRLGWSNVRRTFGGALAALGLAGVLLTGASTFFTPVTQRLSAAYDTSTDGSNSAPWAPEAATAAPAQAAGGQTLDGGNAVPSPETPRDASGTPVPATTSDTQVVTAPSPAPSGAVALSGQTAGPAMVPAPSTATAASAATGEKSSGSDGASGPGDGRTPSTAGGTDGAPSGPTSGSDLRTVGFLAFGLAFAAGLAILAGPRLIGRARRRPRAS